MLAAHLHVGPQQPQNRGSFDMVNSQTRFRCPACGFAIFNRRLAQCEFCKAALPVNRLFNASDLARLQAEADRNAKIRKDLAREAEAEKQRKRRRRGDGG